MNKKCRLIWDDCTPSKERRPTTTCDIEEDIHVENYANEDELFQAVLGLAGYDEEDLDLEETIPMKEKIETVIGYFDDPGDGSPNILYASINGKELEGTLPYDDLDGLDLENVTQAAVIKAIEYGYGYENDDDDDDDDAE